MRGRARRVPAGPGYWLRVPAVWWPQLAAQLAHPWPEEAAVVDLRWWAAGTVPRPPYRELAARWGWTEGEARGFLPRAIAAFDGLDAHPERAQTKGPAMRADSRKGRADKAQGRAGFTQDDAENEGRADSGTGKVAQGSAGVAQTSRRRRSTRVPYDLERSSSSKPAGTPFSRHPPGRVGKLWTCFWAWGSGFLDEGPVGQMGRHWYGEIPPDPPGPDARAALREWAAGLTDAQLAALPAQLARASGLDLERATVRGVVGDRARRPELDELPPWPPELDGV